MKSVTPIMETHHRSCTGLVAGIRTGAGVLRRVMAVHLSFFDSSSPPQGASRTWGLACTLFVFLFVLATAAHAVPPGTIINNTAQASFSVWGTDTVVASNPATLTTEWLRTPAQVELLQYAPTVAGAQMVDVPVTEFDPDGASGGSAQQIASIYPAGSTTAIDLTQPVPLVDGSIYHQGEPLFFRISDPDQNVDPAAVQTVYALVASPDTGDAELLLLSETGPDSGVFIGYIQSNGLGPVQIFNGQLDVAAGGQLSVRYTDAADITDTVSDTALVDPLGRVFDSTTGQPVDNVQIELVDAITGAPATVYGDDGVSTFPAVIASGGTFIDSSGKVYTFELGAYRFPFVLPGSYRLIATPPTGYAAPSTVSDAVLQALPGSPFALAVPGSRGEAFDLNPGPAVRIDIPVDPTGAGLWLRKTVNKEFAAVGDFVQYTISIENTSGSGVTHTIIADRLPGGLRYQNGSLRRGGQTAADPSVAADGRTMSIALGDLADGGSLEVRYVAEVTAGAKPGKAVNSAWATADGGLASNHVQAAVTIREDLFRSDNFIAGRVIADNCSDAPTDAADGVAGVCAFIWKTAPMWSPMTRACTISKASPRAATWCRWISRASRTYTRSAPAGKTRARRGRLFRALWIFMAAPSGAKIFMCRPKRPPPGKPGLQMHCELLGRTVHYGTTIAASAVPLENVRLSVILPDGGNYLKGSSRRNGGPLSDPQQMGNVLIYRLGDLPADAALPLEFSMQLGDAAQPGQLHTKALLTFNTPSRQNQRSEMIDTVLALERRTTREVLTPIVVRPHFDVFSADFKRIGPRYAQPVG